MALPFLPHEHILPAFEALQGRCNSRQESKRDEGPHLQLHRQYLDPKHSLATQKLEVLGQTVRANNEVEGWHRRLNKRAVGGQVHLYVLIPLLHKEAKLVSIHIKLVSEGKLSRYHRKRYRTIQARLFRSWAQYREDEISASQLLCHLRPLVISNFENKHLHACIIILYIAYIITS